MQAFKRTIEDRDTLKTAFWLLGVAVILCSLFYAYLVNKTVLNIVEREKSQQELVALHSRLGELEAEHIALKNKISPEFAATLGFKEVSNPQFITFGGTGSGLSLNR